MRRKFTRTLLATAWIQAITGFSATQSSSVTKSPTECLKTAIQLGLDRSPRMKVTRESLSSAAMQLTNSEVAILPTLALNSSVGLAERQPTTSTSENSNSPYQSSMELKLTESIYDNGVSYNKEQSNRIQLDSARLRSEDERNRFVLDVITRYMDWSRSEIALEAAQEQQKLIERQLKTANTAYRQGMSSKNDFSRIQAESQRSELSLSLTQDTRDEAYATLVTLIGGEPETKFVAMRPESTIMPKTDALLTEVDSLLSQSSLSKQQLLSDRVSELSIDQVRKKLWPEFTLSAAAGYQTQDFVGNNATRPYQNDSTYWNVMLNMNYTLWDWGTSRRNIGIAVAERTVANAKFESERSELKQKLTTLVRQIQQKEKSLKLSEDVLKLEENNYKLMETDYHQGRASYLDLSTVIKNLLDARLQFASNFFGLLSSKYEILYYKGRIYEVVLAS